MLELIEGNPLWFWLFLGGVFLVVEVFSASGHLLLISVAALLVSFFVFFLPKLSWGWQGIVFTILNLVVTYFFWFWLSRRSTATVANLPALNQRNLQLIGTHAILKETMRNGMGRITVGDSSWRAQAMENLPVGTEVEVVAVEGVTLVIRALSSP